MPPRLAVAAALLDADLELQGTWPQIGMLRADMDHALAFIAWRVLPLDMRLSKHEQHPHTAWRLFESAGRRCLQPSRGKPLCETAADLRGQGWLAGATCARMLQGRWFLQLSTRRPSCERVEQVVQQLSGRGARRVAAFRAAAAKLLRGETVHVSRLLCYLQHGALPGGEQPHTRNRGSTLACHSCGNGCCLNQRHMLWGTAAENRAAAVRHQHEKKRALLDNLRCACCCRTCTQLARPPRCDSDTPRTQELTA